MKTSLTLLMLCCMHFIQAQRITVIEGDASRLQGVTSLKTKFVYDNLIVGVDVPEAEYVASKVAAWDARSAGQGEAWKAMWFGERKKKYEVIFRHFFSEASKINAKDSTSDITLTFKTIRMEPGWSAGLIGTEAFIDAEITFEDSTGILVKYRLQDCEGEDFNGGDFEASRRLRQAYMNAGKLIGSEVRKKKSKNGKK